MELSEIDTKVKEFIVLFQQHIDMIIKAILDNEFEIYRELKCVKFFDDVMAANQLMCETRYKIMQIHCDLYEMKKRNCTGAEKKKKLLLIRQYEELFKKSANDLHIKLLEVAEKGNNTRFNKKEMDVWKEVLEGIEKYTEKMEL